MHPRPSSSHHRRGRPTSTRALLALLLATTLILAACGGSSDSAGDASAQDAAPSSPADEGAFPVTMTHAFGETTIDAEPTRVVTWGWASADAAIALGVVPVAMPFASYGADDEGVLPWTRETLEEEGHEIPTVLPSAAEEVPFEAIAAAKPDLILAVYSGITDTDYEKLSQIAPTVAYPDEAWSTPWRDTIELVGEALGRSDAATEVLADIDEQVAAQADAHPELEGKTVAMVWPDLEEFYVYKPADARVAFTLDLGLVSAPSVGRRDVLLHAQHRTPRRAGERHPRQLRRHAGAGRNVHRRSRRPADASGP